MVLVMSLSEADLDKHKEHVEKKKEYNKQHYARQKANILKQIASGEGSSQHATAATNVTPRVAILVERDGRDNMFWVDRRVDNRRLYDRLPRDLVKEIRGRVSKELEEILGVLQNVVIRNDKRVQSHVGMVMEMMKYYDSVDAAIKAKNGVNAFCIAAKQRDLERFLNSIYSSIMIGSEVDKGGSSVIER
nr:ankyrin repeat-containing protein At5g02620-like [Tanacetum cinerariifolium]